MYTSRENMSTYTEKRLSVNLKSVRWPKSENNEDLHHIQGFQKVLQRALN